MKLFKNLKGNVGIRKDAGTDIEKKKIDEDSGG